ncbi:MAG: YaaR family protein [Sporolactobacillus sp.]
MSIEISRDTGIKEQLTRKDTAFTRTGDSFEQVFSSKQFTGDTQALKTLLGQITDQAKRVAGSRTIRDLQIYKRYVQSFLQNAVSLGLKTVQTRSWQQGGTQQTLVKTVNQKLIDLTNDLLDENKTSLDILGHLGEIRGLLVNFYI